MSDGDFRQAVYNAWGQACLVCGQDPEEWIESDIRIQTTLSLHHINGDDTDDRVANVIPLCQDCHIHIHKVDEPPYRQWHRQLPIEHRNAWNAHYKEYYEGPRLTSNQAEWFHGTTKRLEQLPYRRHEPTNLNQADKINDDDGAPAGTPRDGRVSETDAVVDETEADTNAREPRRGVDPDLDPETVSIEFGSGGSARHRIRFLERDDGPGWWQLTEAWTGHRWRPIDRESVTDVDITTY